MTAPATIQSPACPQCGGAMWDETKSRYFKPGQPIFKCKNAKLGCPGVIWAPKVAAQPLTVAPPNTTNAAAPIAPNPAPATQFARLNGLFELHDLCLDHAAKQSKMLNSDANDDAESISSRAATIFIQACKSGLAG